jgi:hypothetical protein
VIHLENSNEWNRKKKDPQKKKKEQGLKSKRGETSFENLHLSKGEKKQRTQAAERDSIERKQESRSRCPIVQNPICGLIHTHISFAFALSSIP